MSFSRGSIFLSHRSRAACRVGLFFLVTAGVANAQKFGAIGDSLTDEYEEQNYGIYAENWVEQLILYGGADFGPTATDAGQPGGTWGEPRRTMHEFNWSRFGATTESLLEDGQHTGVASQIPIEGLELVFMAIGANDVGAVYGVLYNAVWTQSTIDDFVQERVGNIETALDAVLATGTDVIVATVPDYGHTPLIQSVYPNPLFRQRVTDVLDQINVAVHASAQARGLVVVELAELMTAMFGPPTALETTVEIGNVSIALMQTDTNVGGTPSAGFVADGIHPATTLQGVLSNLFATAANQEFGMSLPIFSEAEILAHRGLAYGGSDTLGARIGNYTDYVTSYAPFFESSSCSGDGGDQMGCTECPCSNNAPQGTTGGCLNSAGTSARLLRSGSASIAAEDLRFEASGIVPNNSCVLTSGSALAPANRTSPCFGLASGVQSVSLDGLRCAVQGVLRHGVRPSDASGDVGETTNGWGTPNGFFNFAAFTAGNTRHFQIIHRDAPSLVCMTGQNTSQAVSVTFKM